MLALMRDRDDDRNDMVTVFHRRYEPRRKENFNRQILAQWHSDSERVPPVRFVGLATDDDGKGERRAIHAPQYDGMFTQGVSNATCYEPVFGYRLKASPSGRYEVVTWRCCRTVPME